MKTKLLFVASLVLFALSIMLVFPEFIFSPGKLNVKHAKIEKCATCHEPFTKPSGETCSASGCHDSVSWDRFKGITTGHLKTDGCLKCHTEHKGVNGRLTLIAPHKNVTVEDNCLDCHRLGAAHSRVKTGDCKSCHGMSAWRPAKFDHASVRKDQPCVSCHKLIEKHVKTAAECNDCHTTVKWKPATFDHKLIKAGDNCTSCHKLDAKHFKTDINCGECHSTVKWKPATFKHRFPMNHESRKVNDCKTCHPKSLEKYDCYSGCHEHTESKVNRKHRKERIANFSDCMKCHPTGREHEGERGRRYKKHDDDDDHDRGSRRRKHDDD